MEANGRSAVSTICRKKTMGAHLTRAGEFHGFGKGLRKSRQTCQFQIFDLFHQRIGQGKHITMGAEKLRTAAGGIAHSFDATVQLCGQQADTAGAGRVQETAKSTGKHHFGNVFGM